MVVTKRLDAKRLKDSITWKDGGYRYKRSNRALSQKQVYKVVAQEISRYEQRLVKLTNRFIAGNVPFEEWQARASQLTRDAHVNLLRLGRGGKDRTYAIHYLEVARNLKSLHYTSLQRFAMDIKGQTMTEKQILNRIKLYARSSRRAFEYGRKESREEQGDNQARRTLGSCAPHCKPCIGYAQMGWVSIVDLVFPTEKCDCGGNCCCGVEYRKKTFNQP